MRLSYVWVCASGLGVPERNDVHRERSEYSQRSQTHRIGVGSHREWVALGRVGEVVLAGNPADREKHCTRDDDSEQKQAGRRGTNQSGYDGQARRDTHTHGCGIDRLETVVHANGRPQGRDCKDGDVKPEIPGRCRRSVFPGDDRQRGHHAMVVPQQMPLDSGSEEPASGGRAETIGPCNRLLDTTHAPETEGRTVEEEFSVGDYLDLLRRRAWWIIGLLVASIVLAMVWSTAQTDLYRSSANILINQRASNESVLAGDTSVAGAGRFARTEAAVLASELVAEHATARLGFDAEINVNAGSDTDILRVTAVSDSPDTAQLIAQVFAESYVQVSRDRFAQERIEASTSLAEQIEAIDQQLATATGDEAVRLGLLRDDYAANLDRLRFSVDLASTTRAQIIDNANLPGAPFEPSTTRHLILGGLIGLVLGGAAAVIVESLDRSVTTRADLERAIGGPALAMIPPLPDDDELVALTNPAGIQAEAFRSLRAALEFSAVGNPIEVLQITSPAAAAGKTTIASNLAVVVAQAGRRVAVIDGDFRRPRIHQVFSVDQTVGFTSLILGDDSAGAKNEVAAAPGTLHVIPSGRIPPGPTELLGSDRVKLVFEQLKREFDLVIIDCPPVLSISDALILSRYCDATILAVNARRSRRDEVAEAIDQLRQANAPVIGGVLNEAEQASGRSHRYGYGYGHAQANTNGSVASTGGASSSASGEAAPEHLPESDDGTLFQEIIAESRPAKEHATSPRPPASKAAANAKRKSAARASARAKRKSEASDAEASSKPARSAVKGKGSGRSGRSGQTRTDSARSDANGHFADEPLDEWLDDDR